MEYQRTSFFCSASKGPKIAISPNSPEEGRWPISVTINSEGNYYSSPDVTIHLSNELQLIALKNSIVWELERYRRKVYGK